MTTADVWTCAKVLSWSTKYLADHHFETPRLDAELIMAHCMQVRRIDLYTKHDQPLQEEERSAIRQLIRRRVSGEPVAYLLGEKSFWNHQFLVNSSSLIPRPDTELLVERSLALKDKLRETSQILEIGAGSGCVALSIKSAWPQCSLEAWDISDEALTLCARNAKRLAIEGVEFCKIDGRQVSSYPYDKFDLIVSNPPYISDSDFEKLARNVREFEPSLALRGGADGLDFYRAMAPGVARALKACGRLLLEIGLGQESEVSRIFLEQGLKKIAYWADLSKRTRVVEFGKENCGA